MHLFILRLLIPVFPTCKISAWHLISQFSLFFLYILNILWIAAMHLSRNLCKLRIHNSRSSTNRNKIYQCSLFVFPFSRYWVQRWQKRVSIMDFHCSFRQWRTYALRNMMGRPSQKLLGGALLKGCSKNIFQNFGAESSLDKELHRSCFLVNFVNKTIGWICFKLKNATKRINF